LIVTAITDADSPDAERILATAASLGIHAYRAGSYRYDFSGDVPAQLEALRPRVARLAQLNERLRTTALFHTQSAGASVGGAVWDLWLLLRDLNPDHVAINFDTGHAMVKGGSGWLETARFARRHIRALSVKDFFWQPQPQPQAKGWPWMAQFCVPGQGMVNFRDMFAYFKSTGFNGPMEVHFEYRVAVPGRAAPMNMLGTEFIALLKRDVDFYAALLRETELAPGLGA
jgi:sugar phosphate isomerase/epimerase